jgi:hypothetical protein
MRGHGDGSSIGLVAGADVAAPRGQHVVLFLVILAFLVGRVRAGADPGLARETTGTATQQQEKAAPPAAGSGADPSDPGVDPGANGTTDNFGNGSRSSPDRRSCVCTGARWRRSREPGRDAGPLVLGLLQDR